MMDDVKVGNQYEHEMQTKNRGSLISWLMFIRENNIDKKIDYTHHKTTVNGILIHYVTGGKGDPVVVLLHGWPQTWYEWRHIIPQLIDNNYTVIAPDIRGLGDSEKPQTGYDT